MKHSGSGLLACRCDKNEERGGRIKKNGHRQTGVDRKEGKREGLGGMNIQEMGLGCDSIDSRSLLTGKKTRRLS